MSSDCPEGPAEILLNGRAGILFPVGDSDRLSEILADIDSGQIKRVDFESGIRASLKRFDVAEVMSEFYCMIEELLENRRKGK